MIYTVQAGQEFDLYVEVGYSIPSENYQASVVLDPAVTDDDRSKGRYIETTGPNTIRLWFAAQPVNIIIESVYLEEVQESA